METQQLLRELPKGLIKWYDFDIDKRVLCVVNNGSSKGNGTFYGKCFIKRT